jgi:hypothetical protein
MYKFQRVGNYSLNFAPTFCITFFSTCSLTHSTSLHRCSIYTPNLQSIMDFFTRILKLQPKISFMYFTFLFYSNIYI